MTTEVAEREQIECFAHNVIEVPSALRALTDKEADVDAAADMGCFRILTRKDGDKRVVWCRKVIAEIQAAKQMFMELVAAGMRPYRVGVDGVRTVEIMDEFDPTAEEVIFQEIAPISGG